MSGGNHLKLSVARVDCGYHHLSHHTFIFFLFSDFNTASEIRQCLNEFISLRITLSGTSAVSANTVFAEHVYEYEDVVVGWRFANMVYEKTPRSRLWKRLFRFGRGSRKAEVKKSETYTKVDIALIHDIVPQPGDDYEDLAETSSFGQLGGLFKRA